MPKRPFATAVVSKLQRAGHIAYFAGGYVRDLLMQRPSDDIDIATSASVEQIQALFAKTIPVGVAFGICIVVEAGHQFEVATFRKDRGYVDGRRPTGIIPASPEEDAMRRDFTINGMFLNPLNNEIFDFVGGQKDLKKGLIRAIGDPHERFLEDRLRMMRAARYSTRFHFPIDSETQAAILVHASTLLPSVAMERIWQEFKKMAQFAHFAQGLLLLHRLQLLGVIFPQLKEISSDEIAERLLPCKDFPAHAPASAHLLELFPSHNLSDLFQLCDFLKLSREERDFALFYHKAKAMLLMPESWQSQMEKIDWAKFYAHRSAPLALELTRAHIAPKDKEAFQHTHAKRQELLDESIIRIQRQTPLVRAEHLQKEGIAPGKKMGELLKEAERIAANEGIEDVNEVLKVLKQAPLWKSPS